MLHSHGIALAALCGALVLTTGIASAQWKTQQIDLDPGWNSIYLEVEPPGGDPGTFFSGEPIDSIWMWNRRFESIQFLDDPSNLEPTDPDWLVWFPDGTPGAATKSLFALKGGEGYLINYGGSGPATVEITGRPVAQNTRWNSNSFNLVGFELDSVNPPTISSWFASAPTLQGADSYFRLGGSGQWVQASTSETLLPGEALWVYAKGAADFTGTARLSSVATNVLDYAFTGTERIFQIQNESSASKSYTIDISSSATPPSGYQAIAGDIPVAVFDPSLGQLGEFVDLEPGQPYTVTVPANGTRDVRVALRRDELTALGPGDDSSYQGLLMIKDGAGFQHTIGMRALTSGQNRDLLIDEPSSGGGARVASALVGPRQAATSTLSGLWVGDVVVDQVNQPENLAARNELAPASGEFRYRLLVHIDDEGDARLLQQVTVMSKTDPNTNESELVLVTDSSRLGDFDGVFERNGQLIGQKISSANFPPFAIPNEPPLAMPALAGDLQGVSDPTSRTLVFRVSLDYDNPTNPFLHRYHPDHDNKDFRFDPHPNAVADIDNDTVGDVRYAATQSAESYGVVRDISLEFSGADPRGAGGYDPNWGVRRLGGYYNEEIIGLYRTDYADNLAVPLRAGGTFELVRVTTIPRLNDEDL